MTEMEFQLSAIIKCSGSLTGISSAEIADFVLYCNETLLKKGAPKGGGAAIDWWNVAEEKLELKLVSDRYVRVHDALLRLKKELAKFLGKHRIGLRGVEIQVYEMTLDWDEDWQLKKLPFVKQMNQENGRLKLSLDVDEFALGNRIPDRLLKLLGDKKEAAKWKGKSEHWELLFESEKKPYYFDKDPTEEMLNRGWIRHAAGRGQFIYGPQITKIFRAFERILFDEIFTPLGYEEMIFPKLVTWDVWKRSGHAKGIYPEAYYVCTPKSRDPEYWEEVMDYYKVTNEVPLDMIMERIENVGGMCYAQCPPSWVFLQGKTMPDDILPIKVFDRSGTSHRYESGGIHGIERLDEFHRVEIVWIGKKEQVIEHSKQLQDKYRHIFEEILGIEWREAWVTPWFMAQEGKAGLSELKEAGTTDYEAVLPYSGKLLEFQNVSVNGNKYPKGFNVKLQSGEELWSGCSGVGLQRWAAVFLAQKGFDRDNWPVKFRDVVGELPEVFRFL
ncbi:seryl-tRNA synthetase [Candidatus Methanophagaceae archaeon]|nr:seryl-tRNA synthetase [Methanophagales archaeon]